jgi:hypothetical protein
MGLKLTESKQANVTGRGTENLKAYLKAMQAQKLFYLIGWKSFMKTYVALPVTATLPKL